MAKDTTSNSDRSYGQIAKSAFSGLATFGAETGRLVGKSAKAALGGARRVGSKAKVKAAETAGDLKVKAAETAGEIKVKAAETAGEIKEKASEKVEEIKEKRAADD